MSLKNILILAGVLGWATCLWFFTIPSRQHMQYRLQALEASYNIEKQRGQLLNDELAEIRSKPSYEDGYRDALLKSGNSDHATGYVEGYHAAVKQFGHTAPSPVIAKGGE